MNWTIKNGILMNGRFSVGWNFHPTRSVRTFVLGIAWSFVKDRWLITIGPVTFLWLLDIV